TFAEISNTLARESEIQGYDFNISIRTFQRDLEEIRSLYDIDIQYDFSKKVYKIESDDQSEVNKRIWEAFDTFHALNLTNQLSDCIDFEKRRSGGTENLYGLLHAVKTHVQIKFTYRKYWEDVLTNRRAEPYALKEFRNRWYVLANDLKDSKIKSFALDRLTDLEITTKQFLFPADFDVNEYYRYCFGIISPNAAKPQEVILSFDPFQGKYIKSLPLHQSQEILIDNEEELRIKLTLFITHDFVMELLSYGENVKVLAPGNLVADMKKTYQNALNLY
ncbi:MAG: WYL domain-containing protein, partial [Bacteroidota bacterium]|nr:WYL domain-containing protein [Bacteroidota bacterium]